MDAEHGRLEEVRAESVPWRKWGPYLSERQWGTVRDDYSDNGDAWNYFSHDQARSRAVGHVHGPRAEAVDDHVEESLRVVGEFAGADSVTVAATGSSRAAGRPPTGSVSARARCATA